MAPFKYFFLCSFPNLGHKSALWTQWPVSTAIHHLDNVTFSGVHSFMPQIRTLVGRSLPSHLYNLSGSPWGPAVHGSGQGGTTAPLHPQGRRKKPMESWSPAVVFSGSLTPASSRPSSKEGSYCEMFNNSFPKRRDTHTTCVSGFFFFF